MKSFQEFRENLVEVQIQKSKEAKSPAQRKKEPTRKSFFWDTSF